MECLWDGEGCFVYGGEVVSDQYDVYPLYEAVCAINRKHKQEAQEEMLRSWELAKMDGFLEPFIEHHGLLRGLIEACIRNRDPEAYQRITEGVISDEKNQ